MGSTARSEPEKALHRLSVSLTSEQHERLAQIAQKHRVSISWVVREAIERLLSEPNPLFRASKSDL